MMKLSLLTVLVGILVMGGVALAEEQGQASSARRGPPQEAIDACTDHQASDACSFSLQVEGTCLAPPRGGADDAALVCAPEHRGGRGRLVQGRRGNATSQGDENVPQ